MGIPVEIVGEGIDWPAWVQAVGSIVAIVASAGVAIWISRKDRTLDDQRRVTGAFNAAVISLAFARSTLEAAQGVSQRREWRAPLTDLYLRQLASARAMVGSVILPDMPGEAAAARVVNGFRTLHLAELALEMIRTLVAEDREYPAAAFDELIADLGRQTEAMEAEAKAWLLKKGW